MGDVQVAYKGERETRVTGDEAQGTMGRRNKRGEAGLGRFLLPASLFPQIFIERERETSTYKEPSSPFLILVKYEQNSQNFS